MVTYRRHRGEKNMLIGFVIWSIVALLFLAIAVSSWKSEEAVGFFTFVKPPVVTDITRYNHSVSLLWIIAAIVFEVVGVPLLSNLSKKTPSKIFLGGDELLTS
jgi:small-conductance mechanosensitive channel